VAPRSSTTSSPGDHALGIDIGGTFTKLAILAGDHRVLAEGRVPTQAADGPDQLVERAALALRELARGIGVEAAHARGAGIGVAGLVEATTGVLVAAPNLPGWPGFNPAGAFSAELDCPAAADNDASIFALGEAILGAGQGRDPVVLLTLGTGVGGGVVAGGRIQHGRDGFAGEFGHMALTIDDGPLCSCGARGCVEAFLRSSHVVGLAMEQAKSDAIRPGPALARALASGEATARTVGEAARGGDPLALAVFTELGRILGLAIANLISALNPDAVIVGGGVALAGDVLLDTARATALARVMPPLAARVAISPAALGDRGGVIGACLLGLGHSAAHSVR
jgi:glucokinase